MSEIKQSAGQCRVVISTSGWPQWVAVTIADVVARNLTVSDLHDLRYCIDRALVQVPEKRELTR